MQLRHGGEGTQLTPFGFQSLDLAAPAPNADLHASVVPVAQTAPGLDAFIAAEMARRAPVSAPAAAAPEHYAQPAPTKSFGSVSPATVVKSAKARIKELRAFLRTAKKAEKELKELERLVAAAKRPLAPVESIRKRTTG